MPTDPVAILALRLQGLTYAAIGERVGLSAQRVGQLLSPPAPTHRGIWRRAHGRCQDCGIILGRTNGQAHMPGLDREDFSRPSQLRLLCPGCHRKAHEDGTTPGIGLPGAGVTAQETGGEP